MVWPGRRRREEDNTSGCLPLSPPPPPELAVDDQLLAGGDGGGGKPVAVAVAEDDDSGERWTEDQVPTDEGICVMVCICFIQLVFRQTMAVLFFPLFQLTFNVFHTHVFQSAKRYIFYKSFLYKSYFKKLY